MGVNTHLHRRSIFRLFLLVLAIGFIGIGMNPSAAALEDEGRVQTMSVAALPGIAAREISVWLPPHFDLRRRYAVLYMHDGQMLFDPSRTWNRKAWEVDRVAAHLQMTGKLRDFLIVGIPNDAPRRHAEFFPQAALAFLQPDDLRARFVTQALGGRAAADDYLRFLVEVVKPAVDAHYPTLPGRESTFIMGSSMGGLISLYALCEYPHVFGGAAALSTHWIGSFERNGEIPSALRSYLRRKLPAAHHARIYMDRGTVGLDALYDVPQQQVDMLMTEMGFTPRNFTSKVFAGADHDENSWKARVAVPLEFLLSSPTRR